MKFYFSLLWRRFPLVLVFLILGSALGVTLAKVLPAVYLSRATLLVETSQIPSNLAQTTVQIGDIEQMQIIRQRIISRDNLIDIANRLRVYEYPGMAGKPNADDIVADMRARIVFNTTGGGSARGPQQATIVTVSFEAPDPKLAAAVANELVTQILDRNIEIRTKVAQDTLKFFQDEVDRLELLLSKKEAEILAFQELHINSMPDSLDFRRSQQAAAQDRLTTIDHDVAALRDRRNRLVELYAQTGDIGPTSPTGPQTPEQKQLQSLQDQLSQQLAVLSPDNPRIKVLQAQIAVLEKKVADQIAAATGQTGQPLSPYEVQLADIDGQIEALTAERVQVQDRLDKLQKSIEDTPGNAVTLAALQRDFNSLQAQYNNAVAAKARAQTGEILEALAKAQRITVIEQPTAPSSPTTPNRMLLIAGGVVGGLMAGLGLVVLLELLNTRVRRPADLAAKLGITAFGTVPLILTKNERWRRQLGATLTTLAILIAVPAALWYVNEQITPLDLLLDKLLDRTGLAALFRG